jgi:hypothetical protein
MLIVLSEWYFLIFYGVRTSVFFKLGNTSTAPCSQKTEIIYNNGPKKKEYACKIYNYPLKTLSADAVALESYMRISADFFAANLSFSPTLFMQLLGSDDDTPFIPSSVIGKDATTYAILSRY